MARFIAIDLASLPPIDAVIPPDAATIIANRKAALLARIADPAVAAEAAAVLALDSEPLTQDVKAGAYRELLMVQRINEAVRAVMLATSAGNDLDNLTARLDVKRMTLMPADATTSPPTAAVMENDADLKYRYQLAPEAFSTAGPYGAYEFETRSAHPQVKDCGVYGPESGLVPPGYVRIVVLSRIAPGAPTQDILDAVSFQLSPGDMRPLTDFVQVRPAEIALYTINFHLQIRAGADPALIVGQSVANLKSYAAECWQVGRHVVITALDSAAHWDRSNIVRATRVAPLAEVDPGFEGAPYCDPVTIVVTYEIVAGS